MGLITGATGAREHQGLEILPKSTLRQSVLRLDDWPGPVFGSPVL